MSVEPVITGSYGERPPWRWVRCPTCHIKLVAARGGTCREPSGALHPWTHTSTYAYWRRREGLA